MVLGKSEGPFSHFSCEAHATLLCLGLGKLGHPTPTSCPLARTPGNFPMLLRAPVETRLGVRLHQGPPGDHSCPVPGLSQPLSLRLRRVPWPTPLGLGMDQAGNDWKIMAGVGQCPEQGAALCYLVTCLQLWEEKVVTPTSMGRQWSQVTGQEVEELGLDPEFLSSEPRGPRPSLLLPSDMPHPRAPRWELGIKFSTPRLDPFTDAKTETQGEGSDLLRSHRG